MSMETGKETGVLCHISSLPGKYGIGSLGDEAYRFADLLRDAGVTYWQVLPLVQTGYGDSPYSSVSCTSGNPYFIDLEELVKEKLLTKRELKSAKRKGAADYGDLYATRYPLLRKAFSRFNFDGEDFRAFVKKGRHEDYALFMTAKTVFGGAFTDWEEPIKRRDSDALEKLRTEYHEEYLFWHFLQYKFWEQWASLKEYCARLGIKFLGDIPLYVAYDSADVWANPTLFKLDGELKPTKVAGVPPDYFSPTGQLWGNPVYDWKAHEKTQFAWWQNRLRFALSTFDAVRIDHFRGVDRYYEVDAGAETAEGGVWQKGPGAKLFENIEGEIIAEDLGVIDDGVKKLLKETGFAGMKVLLFAFDGDRENPFLLHNIGENSVCYTGTHDNDTVVGYLKKLSTEEFIIFRSGVAAELNESGSTIPLGDKPASLAWTFVEMALSSPSRLAVLPIQDILGLDNSARMNVPGKAEGNWKFRLKKQPKAGVVLKLWNSIKKYRR